MDRILRQFLAVAETGSVTLAAQRLNVTQPTISVNLLKLEELHQVPLFERGGRGMVLTQFGIILYDHVSAMSRLEAHARARIRALRSSRRQAIRFGCGFAWWAVFMRDVVAEFRADNSDLSLLIDICNTNDGLRNLLSGDIAFFFGSEISHVSPRIGVRFEHLFSMENRYFARPGHPLIGRQVALSEIGGFDRLNVNPVTNSHMGLVEDSWAIDPGLSLQGEIVLSSNSMTVCIDLLHESDAILPYPDIARRFFAAHGISMLNVSGPHQSYRKGLYSLQEKVPSPETVDLLTRVKAAVAAEPSLSRAASGS